VIVLIDSLLGSFAGGQLFVALRARVFGLGLREVHPLLEELVPYLLLHSSEVVLQVFVPILLRLLDIATQLQELLAGSGDGLY
jgi:hypothetical protein